MRKLAVIIVAVFHAIIVFSQAPQGFNYQGVARDNNGSILKSQTLGFRVSILADSTNGTVVYSETHTTTSNTNGVFELVVGQGVVVSGNFSAIDWGSASHFLKTEMDAAGGTSYIFYGTTQLLAVPYAMYAEKAGGSLRDKDFEIINETAFADAPTTACTAALAGLGAGNVDNGTHDYKITYITTSGETEPGPTSNSVTVTLNATDGKISLTNIPVSLDSGVIARKIYRRFYAAGTDYFLVDTIPDNITTIYIDSIGFVSLGDTVPDSNSTKVWFTFDASQLTQKRTYTMPDANGEIALKETLLNNEIMNALGADFVNDAQLLFNADYAGFDNRLFGSGTPNLNNIFYSTFTAEDASTNYGFLYDPTADLYETPNIVDSTEYVIIEATSLSAPWNSNNCRTLPISSGKWLIYCTTGTDAVQRAQIHKSLWYGTNGTNQLILDFTTVTAVKTSHANDVGKRGHSLYQVYTGGAPSTRTLDGTFGNTTTNTNCSSWSHLAPGSDGVDQMTWQIPTGTTRNSATGPSSSNELGTDLTADETNNPSNCRFNRVGDGPNASNSVGIVVLSIGGLTWIGDAGETIIDFFTTHSIPDMVAAGTLSAEGVGNGILIFKDTTNEPVTNAITVINYTIDASSSVQISISADGGGNWTDINNGEGTSLTGGTALWRRIVITRTDNSKIDKVSEQAVKYNFY